MKRVHGSCFDFCCGLLKADFTQILHDYFDGIDTIAQVRMKQPWRIRINAYPMLRADSRFWLVNNREI